MGKPTLRQIKAVEALPSVDYCIQRAAAKAGYAKSTTGDGRTYIAIKKAAQEMGFFSLPAIERDIAETREMAKQAKDITNLNRIDEHRTKIGGHIVDRTKEEGARPAHIVITYGNTRQIDAQGAEQLQDGADVQKKIEAPTE